MVLSSKGKIYFFFVTVYAKTDRRDAFVNSNHVFYPRVVKKEKKKIFFLCCLDFYILVLHDCITHF